MSSRESRQGTQPLQLPKDSQATPPKAQMPTEPVHIPWAVRFVALDQSIPIQLRIDDRAIIGRADPETNYRPDVDLLPYGAAEKGVSRRHAEIRAGKDYLVIIDLGSTNGTRINGLDLRPNEPYRLNHADKLTVGVLQLEVHVEIMPVHDGVKVVKPNTGILGKGPDEEKTLARRRILIVEEDTDTARAFAAMVTSLGYEAHVVNRTGEAMRFIATQVPDGVFVDLDMPDFPGTDICRMIKTDLGNVHVPIFAISSDTEEKYIKSALEAGADVFLSKPVGIDELMQGLQRFVGEANPPSTE